MLLFFIERDELDIHDIPISRLTNDFLDYMLKMKELNIDLASEFILVAATLMRIKAKMLLPRPVLTEQGEEVDPRAELVERLIAYKKFKEVSIELKDLEEERAKRFKRNNKKEVEKIANKYGTEIELESLDLYRLMKVFNRVLERFEERKRREAYSVVQHPYTLQDERTYIKHALSEVLELSFETLFLNCANRIHAIFRFLALLELIQLQEVGIRIGLGINIFWVYKIE